MKHEHGLAPQYTQIRHVVTQQKHVEAGGSRGPSRQNRSVAETSTDFGAT